MIQTQENGEKREFGPDQSQFKVIWIVYIS